MRIRILKALVLALAGVAVQPSFAASSGVSVNVVAQVEQTVTAEDGSVHTQLVEPSKVVPGDEVVFTLTYRNDGAEPAENVVIGNPVPPQMRYVGSSASGDDAVIEFSADGGRTWGRAGELRIRLGIEERQATDADYTNIRWRLTDPVAPGEEGFVRYRAIVK